MQLRTLLIWPLLAAATVTAAHSGNGITSPADHEPARVNTVANITQLMNSTTAARTVLGFTRQGRAVDAYFFPGTSGKKALVTAGMHGSELSSIAVARMLVQLLSNGKRPYYSVIIVPELFPDNAAAAQVNPEQIGTKLNTGRYTSGMHADPNRQMPAPGQAFTTGVKDYLVRPIENENQYLLQLISMYKPERLLNIHAIRDTTKAGIFADPRTDANGIALGFAPDSSLAIAMAMFIEAQGGYAPGNRTDSIPTALYHCDQPAVPPGVVQPRNLKGSALPAKRGEGVSLGTWASTAVCHDADPGLQREAIMTLTMEFPGSKRPTDYLLPEDQQRVSGWMVAYAASIQDVFLESDCTKTGYL